jgi:hypothetical protein
MLDDDEFFGRHVDLFSMEETVSRYEDSDGEDRMYLYA